MNGFDLFFIPKPFGSSTSWQAVSNLGFNIPDCYLEARVQNSSLPVSWLFLKLPCRPVGTKDNETLRA
jgi:hypothetical protein